MVNLSLHQRRAEAEDHHSQVPRRPVQPPRIGCKTLDVQNIPFGIVDSLGYENSTIRVQGWGVDRSDQNQPVPVHVYVDGKYVTQGPANTYRPDVNSAHGLGPNHGFDISLPSPPNPTKVCVHLLNIGAGNANPQIGCRDIVRIPQSDASYRGCRTYQRGFDHLNTAYIPVEGWGFVAWRVRPNVYVTDNCTAGTVTVFPAVYDPAVEAKGGRVRVLSVSYKTDKLKSWAPIPRTQTWPSEAYETPSGCWLTGERLTGIRIVTAVELKAAGGRWVRQAHRTDVFTIR